MVRLFVWQLGFWEDTLTTLAHQVQPTIATKSKSFTDVMAPFGSTLATRTKAWCNWQTVITWALHMRPSTKFSQ